MQYNATQTDSTSQMHDRQPGEVNAGLLMIVTGVLIGTCLTVLAFVTSTSSVEGGPVQELDGGPREALPQAAIISDDAGCSCAGAAAKPRPTQPS